MAPGPAAAGLLLAAMVLHAAAGTDAPTQVHIAQGDSDGLAVTVMWITQNTTDGQVFYGTAPGAHTMVASSDGPAESYSFVSEYTGSYTSGLIHTVHIANLSPSTRYYYVCGTANDGLSEEFSFLTPPAVDPDAPFVFAVVGDLGQTNNSQATRDHILAGSDYGLMLLVGDLSYADSASDPVATGRNCTQKRWDSWGYFMEPLAANMPLMVLPGNHEEEQEGPLPATQTPFLAYQKRFKMPYEDAKATNGNLYYSFNVASAHIIMLNSYMPFDPSSEQYQWLQADLAALDRRLHPWLIACMHAPWYNSNTAHHDEEQETGMRASMEGMLHDAQVDLVFSGHVHAYERMYPVYKNQTTPGATTFINIGDGGNREGSASTYYPQPSWSAFREAQFGHGRLQIFNSTHMQWTWHRILDDESTSADSVTFVKNSALGSHHRGVSAFGATAKTQFDGMRKFMTPQTA